PVRNEVTHIDFVAIRRDREVAAEVPLVLVGEAPATREGLVVTLALPALSILALPGNLPTEIGVDITGITTAHDDIRAGGLTMPEGVTLVTDPDEVVVAVNVSAAAV